MINQQFLQRNKYFSYVWHTWSPVGKLLVIYRRPLITQEMAHNRLICSYAGAKKKPFPVILGWLLKSHQCTIDTELTSLPFIKWCQIAWEKKVEKLVKMWANTEIHSHKKQYLNLVEISSLNLSHRLLSMKFMIHWRLGWCFSLY